MLQIVNGGLLPEGWTVETLLATHRSMPYNPDIANTFFRAGEIEAWGRGIERIIKGCKRDGFSTVDFRYDACGLWTTFTYQYPERAGQTNEKNKNITLLQQEILHYLSRHPQATISDVANILGDGSLGTKYNIRRLKALGLLERIG